MAIHRAEDIVQAVVTTLTGLTTTGSNVFRGRRYELASDELPCLLVYMGPDVPLGSPDQSWLFIDSDLSIIVEAVVKSSAEQVDSVLNDIRWEVSQALHADYRQGLSFVINTTEGAALPEIDGSTDAMVGRLRMEWTIRYRRSTFSVIYALDDDGTLATLFGVGHIATNAPDYLQGAYTFTGAAAGGVAAALPQSANAWTTQAITVGAGTILGIEAEVVSMSASAFDGVGVAAALSSGGPPTGQSVFAFASNSNGSTSRWNGSGISAQTRTTATAGFRLGIELNGNTGAIRILSTDGVAVSSTTFTPGTRFTGYLYVLDAGNPAASATTALRLIPRAAEFTLPFATGTVGLAG